MASLGQRMLRGARWMVALNLSIRLIGFASIAILARVLSPGDFGIVALAMAFYSLVDIMGEFGFDIALIQDQNANRQDYDTAWTLNVLRGVAVALVLVSGAGFIAAYLREPALVDVIRSLAIASVAAGLNNIGIVAFRKDLEFHKEYLYRITVRLSTFLVSIGAALALRNYWALVLGIVTSSFLASALSYFVHPYRPKLDLSVWRKMFRFSKWLLLRNLINFVDQRAPEIMLGHAMGVSQVGVYNLAAEISRLPASDIAAPVNRVLLPGYAKVSHDRSAVTTYYLRTQAAMLCVVLPCALLLVMLAEPLCLVALGPNWIAAVPLIQILALLSVLQAVGSGNGVLFISLGMPKVPALIGATRVAVLLPCLYLAAQSFAGPGVATVQTLAAAAFFPLTLMLLFRQLRANYRDLLHAIWRPVAAALLMTGVLHLLEPGLTSSGSHLAHLVLGGFIAVGLYVFSLYVMWFVSGRPRSVEADAIDWLAALTRRMLKS